MAKKTNSTTSFAQVKSKVAWALYINNELFYGVAIVVVFYILEFLYPIIHPIPTILLAVLGMALVFDIVLLFASKNTVSCQRIIEKKLSLGDDNKVSLLISNNATIPINIRVVEELPFQFQERNFSMQASLLPNAHTTLAYSIRPTDRGVYYFGYTNVYVSSILKLASRRYRLNANEYKKGGKPFTVKVYPSIIQMKKHSIKNFVYSNINESIKRVRRIGHTMEFEQIKEYVKGDNIKDINWKATAKRGALMTNQYEDTQSQHIYTLIDKGRVMKMPFKGMTLMDYAINTSLVISKACIDKHDKAGLCTFSRGVEDIVPADNRSLHISKILEALYSIKTDYKESDFGRLYAGLQQKIKQRSLVFLYTNFESLDSVRRQMPYLRAINKKHLLVLIFFKNAELHGLSRQDADSVKGVFDKVIASQFIYEKQQIISELNKHGINSILSSPETLSIDTLNKYLEIKARGVL
ncbi:MAG: DUF58 domain-containing protein [Bacteroidales bacterium]